MMVRAVRSSAMLAALSLAGCVSQSVPENSPYFTRGSETIYSIAYSPDGKQIATGHCWLSPHDERSYRYFASKGFVDLWSAAPKSQPVVITSSKTERVAVPTFAGDQSLVVHDTSELIFCDAAGTEQARREIPRAFALDTAHQLVACLTDDDQPHRLQIRNFDGDIVSSEFADPNGRSLYPHTRRAFSPDGHFLAACTRFDSRSVQIWNWSTGELVRQFEADEHERIYCPPAFNNSSDALAYVQSAEEVRLHNIHTGELLQTFAQQSGRSFDLCFSPDDRYLALCGSGDDPQGKAFGFLLVWDVESGTQLSEITRADVWGITAMQFSPDGQTLAAGLSDGKLVTYSRHELLK